MGAVVKSCGLCTDASCEAGGCTRGHLARGGAAYGKLISRDGCLSCATARCDECDDAAVVRDVMECAKGIVRAYGPSTVSQADRDSICAMMDHYAGTAVKRLRSGR